MRRNSSETRQRILDGLESLITREGFTAVGVNAIAREASVDKVLIYRYFGSLEGLLTKFSEEKKFYPGVSKFLDNVPEDLPISELVSRMIIDHAAQFQECLLSQELACWELNQDNPLTRLFAKKMEEEEFSSLAERGIIPEEDTITLSVILFAGLRYLILRGRNNNPVLDLDYSNPEIRKKIEIVVSEIVKSFFEAREGSL